jgi:hypothetical protein
MGKEWLQLALKMAENARAGLTEERKQEDALLRKKTEAPDEQPAPLSSR